MISFKPKKVTKILIGGLKDRTRDILVQRYGLNDGSDAKTLEAIGQIYGITRERVRQIENFALNSIRKSPDFESVQDVFEDLKSVISKKGGVVSELEFLDLLSGGGDSKNHIIFLLVLGEDFTKFKEDQEFNHRWTIDYERAIAIHDILRRVHQKINEGDLITDKVIVSYFDDHVKEILKEKISEDVVRTWLNLSRVIDSNELGEWGLVASNNVRPKGMRDFTFLVLRKHGSPMHFSEVADSIKDLFDRSAHPATVHNELIKDDRFVLVGRGMYALKIWGYSSGVVRDVIKSVIERNGPLVQSDIVKHVLKERYVKENTILVNLRNNKHFKRHTDDTYHLA